MFNALMHLYVIELQMFIERKYRVSHSLDIQHYLKLGDRNISIMHCTCNTS